MTMVELVNKLRDMPTPSKKIEFIKQHKTNPLFTELLKFTYEPLWKYGIQRLPWEGSVAIGVHFDFAGDHIYRCLRDLRDGYITGNAAKEKVANLTQRLKPADAELFKCILKKDLRAGISVTTINKAIPGLIDVFGVMLAKSWNGEVPSSGLWMSLKYDGLRAYYKHGCLVTRNGHQIKGVDHIVDRIGSFHTEFDGELMIPDAHFQTTSGKLRSFEACPTAVYHVFDMPEHGKPFEERYARMVDILGKVNSEHVQLVKHVHTRDAERIERTYQKALDNGYEGLVLKTLGHMYANKRSSDWLKLKAVRDKDLTVVGFFEGEGKYAGSLGGIIVDHEGVLVKVGSGFSDWDRMNIWGMQQEFLNRTAEIHYHEETPDRSLRHPRFKGFRVDK